MANSSFYANGLPYGTDETGVGNVPSGPDGPKTAESSFYLSGGRYSTEGVGVGNVTVDTPATAGSFYANGIAYGTDETGLGNVPVDPTPTPALSSFYQSGTVYSTVQNIDADKAEIDADRVAAQAAADAAAASQYASASSASDAATSAANAATAVQLAAGTATPLVDGTAAVGTGTKWAHEDHVHPTDTSRAAVTYVDAQDTALATAKADKTYVDAQDTALTSAIALKAATTYVDTKDALKVAKAGDTMTGALYSSGSGTGITSASLSTSFNVMNSSGVGHAYMTFYAGGYFGANFGIASDGNFYMGGISHGAVTYKFWTSRDFNYTPVSKAGDTMTGSLTVQGDIYAKRADTGVVYLGTTGSYYLYWNGSYYTLASAHLYTAAGRVLGTSTDAGLIQNGRLAFAADYSVNANGMTEPYGGAVMTGLGWSGGATNGRFRYMQLQNYNGTWFTIGYV